MNVGAIFPSDFTSYDSKYCGVGLSVEINIEREFDVVTFGLSVELVEDVAELCIPPGAIGLLLADGKFRSHASAHIGRVNHATKCPPIVEWKFVQRLVFFVEHCFISCIAVNHNGARVVGVAVAPLFEGVQAIVGSCIERYGISIVRIAAAIYRAAIFSKSVDISVASVEPSCNNAVGHFQRNVFKRVGSRQCS